MQFLVDVNMESVGSDAPKCLKVPKTFVKICHEFQVLILYGYQDVVISSSPSRVKGVHEIDLSRKLSNISFYDLLRQSRRRG